MSTRHRLEVPVIRIRPFRPLLALALIPAAGGIALASAGSFASAAVPPAHVQMVRSVSTPAAVADDHGGARPTPRPTEAGDDSGGHGGRVAGSTKPRPREAGDDSGGHGGRITSSTMPRPTRTAEAGDDSGGSRPAAAAVPRHHVEPGDDSGRHGDDGSRHGGADDGPHHS
jgi:hypothetical protein